MMLILTFLLNQEIKGLRYFLSDQEAVFPFIFIYLITIIVIWAFVFIAIPACVIENLNIIKSLKRSLYLPKHHHWSVFKILGAILFLIPASIYLLTGWLYIYVSFPTSFLSNYVLFNLSNFASFYGDFNFAQTLTIGDFSIPLSLNFASLYWGIPEIVRTTITVIAQLVTSSLITIASGVVYFNLRQIHGGTETEPSTRP